MILAQQSSYSYNGLLLRTENAQELLRPFIADFTSGMKIQQIQNSSTRARPKSLAQVFDCTCLSSFTGILPLSLGVLTHEGSTVVVCLNSLRLLFVSE